MYVLPARNRRGCLTDDGRELADLFAFSNVPDGELMPLRDGLPGHKARDAGRLAGG